MARGNEIVVTADPKGHFEEVIVSGTPKPGTVMEFKHGTALSGDGKWTFEPAGTTAASGVQGMSGDGVRLPIAVLTNLIGAERGLTNDDARTSGTREMLYFPVPGEELNMIIENQSGTADDFAIGDKLIVDDGTGKLLISAGSVESEPFICLETLTDLTADNLTWVKYTGY